MTAEGLTIISRAAQLAHAGLAVEFRSWEWESFPRRDAGIEVPSARASALAAEAERCEAAPARQKLKLVAYHSISGLGDWGA